MDEVTVTGVAEPQWESGRSEERWRAGAAHSRAHVFSSAVPRASLKSCVHLKELLAPEKARCEKLKGKAGFEQKSPGVCAVSASNIASCAFWGRYFISSVHLFIWKMG